MLLLGHPGITLGATLALVSIITTKKINDGNNAVSLNQKAIWLSRRIDLRLLLVGSLLPDIIDKPLGHLIFGESISNGRIFAHTLLFLTLLSLAGWYLYRRERRSGLLVLSLGTFFHLLEDEMWAIPQTLFWPLLGLPFPRLDLSNFIFDIWQELLTNPSVYIPELIGAVVLLWFAFLVLRHGSLFRFIRHGRI